MDTHVSLREFAGAIVRDEMARNGYDRRTLAEAASLAPSTLGRVIKGEDNVGDLTLRQVEGALNLPRRLLTMVIEGDEESLRELEMAQDLRRFILSSVADIKAGASRDEKPRKGRRHG